MTAAIAAGSAPRPGVGVDADGIEHPLPDQRTPAQRALDALLDAVSRGCPGHPGTTGTTGTTANAAGDAAGDAADDAADDAAEEEVGGVEEGGLFGVPDPQPPDHEGEPEIRRPPGVRTGPPPDLQIVVTATLEQLAHALHRHTHPDTHPGTEPSTDPGSATDPPLWPPDPTPHRPPPRHRPPPAGSPSSAGTGPGFARARHGDPVHPSVLGLLACTGRLRRALLDPHGAALHLGRTHRLATPAQRTALLARDHGCVIPGCTVPADRCDIHHITPWTDGGGTDIDNLALACPRHHIEIGDGTWHLQMINGVPWARPPAWAHPTRPLLRNASHRA